MTNSAEFLLQRVWTQGRVRIWRGGLGVYFFFFFLEHVADLDEFQTGVEVQVLACLMHYPHKTTPGETYI